VEPQFQRYLLVGGFPETARQPDLALCQRLLREDVVERVLKRDMAALFGVRNVNDLERLFIYLCLHSGGIVAIKTCADALGSLPATVSSHLEFLREANLIYRVGPYQSSGKKALKARYKIYLVDAALRNAVLLRGEQTLTDPQEMGTIVETAVLRHLYAYYYRDTPETLYWRDPKSDKEVDIIVKSPSYTIPVEVKYRDPAPLTEDSGLVTFCRLEQPYHAFWVTRRDDDFGMKQFAGTKTRFLQIPAHMFLFLVGQAERLQWEK
jgi:predicted AAA+ superfamily ATPase